MSVWRSDGRNQNFRESFSCQIVKRKRRTKSRPRSWSCRGPGLVIVGEDRGGGVGRPGRKKDD